MKNISQNNDKNKVPPFADFESNLEPIFLSLTNEEANELVKESPKKGEGCKNNNNNNDNKSESIINKPENSGYFLETSLTEKFIDKDDDESVLREIEKEDNEIESFDAKYYQ